MTDPVVMPPVSRPGPDMMLDRGDVMPDPVVMPPSPPARSRHDRPWHGDLSSPPYDRHDAVTETGRWAFPLPWDGKY
ncbi:hypothetical protein AALO_G00270020 [Alosa alosa]|uniref:Uncharacterized protein n=1 Tax=Alosa alosa TaxID=278164 RepID=A0AAV6FM18_9TELE|nr:hypothetical protein AALO_G00270020 [Alosa alosa]